jgi:cation:H+ antiporter
MLISIVLLIIGMVLLIKGGDILIDGASSLARRYKISEFAIGLTIVGFGTSAPEFAISLLANINNNPEIALGNVIGSINFNLFFILGITGLLMPIVVQKNTVRIEIPFSFLIAVILVLFANFSFITSTKNMIGRFEGLVFIILFGLFIFYVFKSMKSEETDDSITPTKILSLGKSIIFITLGLIMLVGGGRVVVDSAVNIANILNISQKIIALTIVAVGTSLPELVTSILAII